MMSCESNQVPTSPTGAYHPGRPSPKSCMDSPPTLPYTRMPAPSLALRAPLAITRALPLCRHTLNLRLHVAPNSARIHLSYSAMRSSCPLLRMCSGTSTSVRHVVTKQAFQDVLAKVQSQPSIEPFFLKIHHFLAHPRKKREFFLSDGKKQSVFSKNS